jgi:hypothetical protein
MSELFNGEQDPAISEIVSNGIRGKGEIPFLHKEVQG